MTATYVSEVMTKDVFSIEPNATVTEAAKMLVDHKVSGAPVVDGGELVGIVTESDLIMKDVKLEFPTYLHVLDGFIASPRKVAEFEAQFKKAIGAEVRDVMTSEVKTVAPGDAITDAATLLADNDISMLPVVEGDTVVGVITKADIIKSIAE